MTYSAEIDQKEAAYWTDRRSDLEGIFASTTPTIEANAEEIAAVTALIEEAVPTGGRVLDFGCGDGRFRDALSAMSYRYEGVDLIPGLSSFDWDFETLPPVSFDCVVALFVFQHIADAGSFEHWLLQLHACLKPGGILIILDRDVLDDPAEHTDHLAPRGVLGVMEPLPWQGARNQPGVYPGHWFATFAKVRIDLPEDEAPVFIREGEGARSKDPMPEHIAINRQLLDTGGKSLDGGGVAILARRGDVIDFQLTNGRWVYNIVGWHGFDTAVAKLEYHE